MKVMGVIPTNYDVSLTFIVIMVFIMTIYMGFRLIRRVNMLTIGSFVIQLCILTVGVLTVINKVMSIPLFEIVVILFGVIIPSIFLISDYHNMKKRIKKSNSDVPLVEKLEKPSNKSWRYEEYIESPDEWKCEIEEGIIARSLEISDDKLKQNITNQLSIVHKLVNQKSFSQALTIYKILSGILCENPLILYNTAYLYQRECNYEEAINHYKKVFDIINNKTNKVDKNKKTSKNNKNIKMKNNSFSDVEDVNSITHFGYGLCLYAIGKYELAINEFELVLKEYEGLKEAMVNIARCYIAISDFKEAQNYIKSALKVNEDNKLRFLLAKLCYEKNEELECLYQLETIVTQDSEFTEAWVLIGKISRKNKDWGKAQIAYKKLTQLLPQDAENYYRLGISQREDGKTEEALYNLRFATELMPNHSRAFFSIASIIDAEGKTERAIECLKKSLEGAEKLEMAYNLLAEIYISIDKINEAINVYEASIREHADSYLLHYNLGVSLMMMKRYEEAVRAFRRAQKLTYDDAALYYNWASASIGLKNYSEAARLYKEGLKLKSDDDEILFGLARVSALQGDIEATLGFLSQAFEINENLRLRAKVSHDFAPYRTLPEFMELTRLPIREEKKHA